MTNTINTAAIEALRIFAVSNGELRFAHLCSAALAGEEWAAERIVTATNTHAKRASKLWHQNLLHAIRATDTTRPDGAIARKLEV